jgi:putative transposase
MVSQEQAHMPRRPRVFVEGAVYHVYNRFAQEATLFSDRGAAERFLDLLSAAHDRDGLTVLAWCLMANHYHLALRTSAVPLARAIGGVQARFGQGHNRRTGSKGPLWQDRYQAKIVRGERHLMQLIAYIHLNPVAARLVSDPALYALCGHSELMGTRPARLIDVDGVLVLFDSSREAARRAYLRMLKADAEAPWLGEGPGRLPWWRREPDTRIVAEPAAPRLDPLGRSAAPERPRLDARAFMERACAALEAPPECLSSPKKDRTVAEVRYLVAGLAIERWRIRAGELAAVVGRLPEAVSRWAARAGELRQTSEEFRRRYEELDTALSEGPETVPYQRSL